MKTAIFAIFAVLIVAASCSTKPSAETTVTDSTAVCVDSAAVIACDSAKVDSL